MVAQKALDCGATVVMFDIAFSEESLPNGERAIAKTVDLLDVDSIQEQLADLPRVDVVLNLAGGFTMGPTVYEVEDKDWNFLFDINVSTMRNMIRVAVPKMLAQGGGAIVNVGALAALEGVEAMGAYCASKSVVMRLTESLSAELKQQGINVNAVLPEDIGDPIAPTIADQCAIIIIAHNPSGTQRDHPARTIVQLLSPHTHQQVRSCLPQAVAHCELDKALM